MPDWWADADPDDRRALAATLFALIRVLGIRQVQDRADAGGARPRSGLRVRA